MQAYRIVFIVLLTIEIVQVASHKNGDGSEDQKKQNVEENMATIEINALRKMLTSTNNLKTGYLINHGVQRDMAEPMKITQDSNTNLENERFLLYEKMNSRMVDLQCTYAQYAQKHLTLLWSVVDQYLLYENISEILFDLQSVYIVMAKKTIVTLYNKNYEPSKWMYDLLEFLQMKSIDLTTYTKQLSEMLTTLMVININYPCKLNSIPIKNKINYINVTNCKEIEELYNVIYGKNHIQLSKWIKYNNVRTTLNETYAYKKKRYDPNSDPRNQFEIPMPVRVCDTFLFNYFQYITRKIGDNLFGIQLTICDNRDIFPYDNYDECNIQPPQSLEMVPITVYNNKTVEMDSDFYVEFSEVNSLHGKVLKMINNAVWRSENTKTYVQKIKNKDVKVNENTEKFDYKNYYRSEHATLMNIKNSLMYDLQCTYAYYAKEHLNGITLVLNDERSKKCFKCNKDDVLIIENYFDISLKTLDTVYSSGYQAPEWMLRLVLYLSKVSELSVDLKNFQNANGQMLKVLNGVITSCKLEDVPPIKLKLPKEMIKTTIEYQPIYRFINVIDLKDTRMKYVTDMYNNIIRIKNFLYINENVLPSTDYEQFNPSTWVFLAKELTTEKINNLRWDTKIRLGKDDRWNLSPALIFGNLKDSDESSDEFRNSVLIYSRIIDFVRVAIIRYVILLGGYCSSITYAYNYFNEAVLKYSNPVFVGEYTQYCSNIQKSIGDLLECTGLKTDRVFLELIDALVVLQFNADIFQTKGFRLAVKKLNQFSVNLYINAHVSLIYRWVMYTSSLQQLISINKSILNVLLTIIKDVNEAITNYVKILKNDFKDINFNILSLVSNSFGNTIIYKR